ncbi:MAG: ABC transporter ATP-binding protein [Oscillospiraceae bacterium]|nr:ABC transporter ATP-binding protein [Oscillospiraceae bacterium]MDD4368140.1 ABC transporter ATP-binding protein [Oscillospiraceae bacterium]
MNDLSETGLILKVQGLGKHYPSFDLHDIDFDLPQGYIMGFIGPNGAGKTTTIKSILGLIRPDQGQVTLFASINPAAPPETPQSCLAKHSRIGVVMDRPLYNEDWTVRQIARVLAPFYPKWDDQKFQQYISRFALSPDKKLKELSRGMQVKLQLAVALSHHADLLILDEPTSGLDPVARDEICDLLCEFVSDPHKSVLFSTHITADLEKIADYLTFILNGRMVYSGSKDDLLEKYVRVAGGLDDLTPQQQALIIGYRAYSSGFEGMCLASHLQQLPRQLLTEPVTLDELIVYMHKGEAQHA